jgi:site-specific recombinase XerD
MMENEIHHFRDGNVVLYKRERSERWQARLKLPNNKWKRISTKRTDLLTAKDIACDKYDEFRFRVKSKLPLKTKKFRDVAQLAIKNMKKELDSGYGKKTYLHYIGAIERYLIPFFGETHIDNIDYRKLKEFDEWRIQKVGRKLKRSTLNNHNSAMNRIFRTALEQGWINENQIPQLKNKGEKSQRRPHFEREEYILLYKYMRDWCKTGRKQKTRDIRQLLRDYVLILTNTGMRHGTETANLKWNNIEEFTNTDGKKYLRIWVNGKTGKRQIIARHAVRRYLKRIQNRVENLKDLTPEDLSKVDEYVFRLPDRSEVTDWHGAFEILMEESGLLKDRHGHKRTLYSLRHTYATFALLNGIDIHVLATQMGTSIGMLEKHYSHLTPTLSAEQLAGKEYRRIKRKPKNE